MSLKAINPEMEEISFERYGDLQGMLAIGLIETGNHIEILPGQEVYLKRGDTLDLVIGLKFGGGTVNGVEFHSVTPEKAGNIGVLYQAAIKGGYIGEPIIGAE